MNESRCQEADASSLATKAPSYSIMVIWISGLLHPNTLVSLWLHWNGLDKEWTPGWYPEERNGHNTESEQERPRRDCVRS
jgi:hypothetical protein